MKTIVIGDIAREFECIANLNVKTLSASTLIARVDTPTLLMRGRLLRLDSINDDANNSNMFTKRCSAVTAVYLCKGSTKNGSRIYVSDENKVS